MTIDEWIDKLEEFKAKYGGKQELRTYLEYPDLSVKELEVSAFDSNDCNNDIIKLVNEFNCSLIKTKEEIERTDKLLSTKCLKTFSSIIKHPDCFNNEFVKYAINIIEKEIKKNKYKL